MKNSIYEFIKSGLENFTDNDGIYDRQLKNICLELNDLLNYVEEINYEEHINKYYSVIDRNIQSLSLVKSKFLYINLVNILCNVEYFQNINGISEKDYRDHYLHSIQCFLLSISFLSFPKFKKIFSAYKEKIIYIIFCLTLYHDLGYLYKIKKIEENNFNNTMKEILKSKNSIIINVILIDMFCLDRKKEDTYKILESSIKLGLIDEIWNNTITKNDYKYLNNICNLNNISKENESKHSFMSTIFLLRVMRTKQELLLNNNIEFNNNKIKPGVIKTSNIYDKEEEVIEKDFKEIILSILMHGFDLEPPISFESYPLSSLLLIIDELQSYGRLFCEIPGIIV